MLNIAEQMKKENYTTSHFEFTFSKGDHTDERYEVDVLVPIVRMTEACTTLRLEISSLEKLRFYYTIGLDTKKWEAAILEESSLLEKNFTKAFTAELDRCDWAFLRVYNRLIINRVSEKFTEFETLEVDFTDYVQDIEKEGHYVSYHDIFPNAKYPSLLYKGERYYIRDEYYIAHDTPNSDCGLTSMVMEKNGSFNWKNPKTRLAALDYELQTFSSYDEGVYYDQAMFMEVNRLLPDLASLVKQRHANLRLVYENFCKRKNLHFPAPKGPAIVQSYSFAQGTYPLAHHFSLKVGRNDPCPCGSGKKYKKCCMQ